MVLVLGGLLHVNSGMICTHRRMLKTMTFMEPMVVREIRM